MRPPRCGGVEAQSAEALHRLRVLAHLARLEHRVEQPDGRDVVASRAIGNRSAKKPASADWSCVAFVTTSGAVDSQRAELRQVHELVEATPYFLVVVLIAERVETRGQFAGCGRDRARRLGPAEEQPDHITRGLLLRADLLVHERLERRHERGVLRAQAAAHRLALHRLPGLDHASALCGATPPRFDRVDADSRPGRTRRTRPR